MRESLVALCVNMVSFSISNTKYKVSSDKRARKLPEHCALKIMYVMRFGKGFEAGILASQRAPAHVHPPNGKRGELKS